jgi:tRNA G26 N,N-dimethylase Trm1
MQITLENLTPQQAWELAIAYSQITKSHPIAERKTTTQRLRTASQKYKRLINYDDDFISMCCEMYHLEKLNLNQITHQLNEAGYRTVTGAKWRNGGVWYVLYSKQAKSITERITNDPR